MSTLNLFPTEALTIEDTDLLHLKRGVGINSDKRITGANFKKLRFTKSIVIENPSNAEDISFSFTDVAISITKIRAILVGSGGQSLTWTIRHSTDRSAIGNEVVTGGTVTTDITTGVDITSFNDATIPANSHIWIETTAKSGTINSFTITVFQRED